MQYLGLQKILTLISTDPSDLIINRYVSLVKDMQDEQDKANCLLDLSKILLDIDPQETLKYALPVFEHSQSLEALQIIYKAVLALGKDDKADVIKKEIERLKQLEDSKELQNANARTSYIQNTTRTMTDEELTSVKDTFLINDNSQDDITSITNHLPLASGGDSSFSQRSSFSSELKQSSTRDRLDDFFNSQVEPSISRDPRPSYSQTPTYDPNRVSNYNSNKEPNNYDYSSDPRPVYDSAPRPSYNSAPTSNYNQEPARHQKDSVEEVMIELFDFYWKNGFVNEARSLLQECREVYSKSPWWLARISLVNTMPSYNNSPSGTQDGREGFLQQHLNKIRSISGQNSSSPAPQRTREEVPAAPTFTPRPTQTPTPTPPQDPFWSYLDILISENNYRKALYHIRKELKLTSKKKHTMEWARLLYPKLNDILEKLEYRKISWDFSREDESVLFSKILNHIPQKLSSIIL